MADCPSTLYAQKTVADALPHYKKVVGTFLLAGRGKHLCTRTASTLPQLHVLDRPIWRMLLPPPFLYAAITWEREYGLWGKKQEGGSRIYFTACHFVLYSHNTRAGRLYMHWLYLLNWHRLLAIACFHDALGQGSAPESVLLNAKLSPDNRKP